jgi:hypothetical protein
MKKPQVFEPAVFCFGDVAQEVEEYDDGVAA